MAASALPASVNREQLLENDPALAQHVPLRKNAWPEEMANVISFLLSAESSHGTGVNIEVHGGLSNTSTM